MHRLKWAGIIIGILPLLGLWLALGPVIAVIAALATWLVGPVRDRVLARLPFLRSPGRAAVAVFLVVLIPWVIFWNVLPHPPAKAPTSEPTAVPTATPIPPSPTPRPSPTPQVGTRENPVPFGQAYVFRKGGSTYAVAVVKVIRNAWPQVKAANMFNEPPPPGYNYILVALYLKYIEGPKDRPMTTSSGEHRFYAGNRLWGAPLPPGDVPPQPRFYGQDIFPGAEVVGWLGGKYLPVELMDEAVLVYDGVYFALR